MALDLEKKTGSVLRILPNRNSITWLHRLDPDERVWVWKLGSSASAGVGFYHNSSRAAILDNLESPAQQREERDPVFQDYHVTALFLFWGDLLRVYVLHPHLVRPVQPLLAERI